MEDVVSEITASTSTQIIIQREDYEGNLYPIGAAKKLCAVEDRQLIRREEYENGRVVVKLVSAGPSLITVDLERVVFDRLGADFDRAEELYVLSDRPMNIQVFNHNEHNKAITTYHNCLFSRWSKQVVVDDYVIFDSATALCERISISTRDITTL